jgi:TPP-dependent pyruvate/acetoin dehydrogenase alpha subunit
MEMTPLEKHNLPGKETMLGMYRDILRIRRFEERAIELFEQEMMRALLHPYLGQEAVAVGVCTALGEGDYITSTHRGHGHCIAKGAKMGPMMAELLGKKTGYCGGKGGSMHIADVSIGILGANGIVGAGLPIAVGSGLTAAVKKTGSVTACFFGDGASNQGTFHESLNMAAIWSLPVVFVCENNLYALSTPVSESVPLKDIADRAAAYGMPKAVVNGNDILDVYQAAESAVGRARSGGGPTLIEAKTYRWEGHYHGEKTVYRTQEELDGWKCREPLSCFRTYLLERKLASPQKLEALAEEVEREIEEAVRFALESPEPGVEEATQGLYVAFEVD